MYRLCKIKDLRGYRFFQNFRWDEANCRLFNQNNLIYGWNGSPFSSKVAVEREDFDRLSTLAKKYVTAEKKESKLQKAVDAASKLIAKLKAKIDSLKQEISDYKSVHSKLRAAELERENTELRGKVRSYEDVIQRNNLWRFFHPLREKAVTRDEAR